MTNHSALAQEELRDHYKFPRNKKIISPADFTSSHLNRSCGDVVTITGTITNDVITDIGFDGSGCIISQAAASMLTEMVLHKSVEAAKKITPNDVTKMIGIPLGPNRLKCALLALTVLQQSLARH